MKAGRELDRKIARVLFGLPVRVQLRGTEMQVPVYTFKYVRSINAASYVQYQDPPPYSTQMSAAHAVLEQLRQRYERTIEIRSVGTTNLWHVKVWGVGAGRRKLVSGALTNSLPFAICLAAIRSFEKGKQS